ncbi:hypothetical protein EDB81DRAFT_145630 [Dactylonectria macrodidyma]|uniref:Mid2 domain-containing protein n=1 Tax=Dactylonectria macrodidyma TaxID=307937 RepID=A0A9P9INZ6_9HYPO|nr:hypothetical protein EDB81DRAFT_145630 [Dactylonectria macrodidyma]
MNRLVLLTASALATLVSADCFYPDGSLATNYNYQPCTNTTYASCCYFGEGDICLPNGLCDWPSHFDYRAACQNPDWSDCPEVCLDEGSDNWLSLAKCAENEYCCPTEAGSNCCVNGSQITTLSVPGSDRPSTTADKGSSSTDESEVIQTSADVTREANGSESGGSVVRTTIRVTTTANRADDDDEDGDGSSVPVGAIAGGAVGGVLVLGLIAIGIWYLLRRRPEQPAAVPTPVMVPATGAGFGGAGGAAGYYGGGDGNMGMQQPQQFHHQQQFVQPNMAMQYSQQYQMPQTTGGGVAKTEHEPTTVLTSASLDVVPAYGPPAVQQRQQGSTVVELA